ncbi:beta-1,6-N-acetylglucosaminyltransferase [Maledivibacter halophilus]|uniref:Peptide O-xylosyltransferase n=1 Tax=Maledivibacter halophilus TaxID=36842 RepID=A0A1T5L2U1_9FIRM|nr:beta-1,6-N-acetylglucosaminyltransferase [Maledivibacter halophilus]SKC69929.1 Core-2/I-Branching enzyme [Maledivibacter halophilus]
MTFSLDFGEQDYYKKMNKSKVSNMNDQKKLKISFLILAHKDPFQLITFINTLDCEDVNFFIHVDKKSSMINHTALEELKHRNNVFFIEKRYDISWGGYKMIEATIGLMKEALKKSDCDYISLHSGQDLPIKNKYEIINFLKRNRGKEFINHFSLNVNWWWPNNALDRIRYYWFIDQIGLEKSWELYEVQKKLKDKRKFLKDIKPYAGWQWWTITRECTEYIINYLNQNQSFCDYYKYTLIPDEGFFQTIVLNSHFRNRVINNNLRFIAGGGENLHPKTLTRDDYNYIMMSDMLFARKFDTNVDNEIIEIIKNRVM